MIELLCTIAGLLAGVIVVASLFQPDQVKTRFRSPDRGEQSPEEINSIAHQLQLITSRVSAKVTEHSEKVGDITNRIEGTEEPEAGKIVSAIEEIIDANRDMQTQLESARQRIAMQRELIEKTSQQARTDALTGLSNRRALDEFVESVVTALPEDEKVGLLLMDIDHFKSFNDNFGHTTGDAVLASFARSILKAANGRDYVARYGGEEFAVVLHGETLQEIAYRAAIIRHFVSNQVISYEDLQLKITSSAGVCLVMQDDDAGTVYERADEGLYQSKNAGRNCGHYLAEEGWRPLPDVTDESVEQAVAEAAAEEKEKEDEAKSTEVSEPTASEEPPTDDKPAIDATPPELPQIVGATAKDKAPEEPQAAAAKDVEKEEEKEDEKEQDRAEVLELLPFLQKMEPSLDNLRRAEMPAAAIMVEAIGLEKLEDSDYQKNWEATVELVQLNLRGIDLVCQFRRQTLCIFITGCSEAAAFDRASKIQLSLAMDASAWTGDQPPERLALAVAGIGDTEDCSAFLDRLESALDHAHSVTELQIVVHDGSGFDVRDSM